MIYFPSSHIIEHIQHGDFGLLHTIVKDNNIKTLDFSNKAIDAKTAPMIAEAVKGLDVTCLNFSHNSMGPEGALALIESLQDSNITEIDLSRNAIGAAVVDVFRALAATPIKVVKLAYNQIGMQGLAALAPVVSGSNVKVDLSNNMYRSLH